MKLGDLIVRLGMNTRDFDKKIGAAMGRFRSFGRNMKRVGKNLSASITAPLGVIAGTSVKVAADFEQAMAKVKAVSGATAGEFKALEEQAKKLGSTTVFTAQQVAGLQENFAKLGFTSEEIGKVTEATLMLAQASGSDLAQAAEVAGGTLRAFGMDADETAHLTDVMAKSFSTSALDLERFQESMKYVAPVAKSAGISVEQTTAMLGLLANAGVHGSQAGTALRRIISELGATGGDVAGTIKKLAGEGLNLADAKDEVGRSAQSALLILAEGIDTLGDYSAELEGADGAAAGMAATMNDTTTGAMLRMQSAVEGAQIAIGTALAPVVEQMAQRIEELAGWFSSLDEDTQGLIITVAGLAAAIGPMLVVGPQVASAIIGITKAVKGMNLAMLASPWGVIAGLVGVAAVAFISYKGEVTAAEEAQRMLTDAQNRGLQAYAKEAAKVNVLVTEFEAYGDTLERRQEIIADLQAINPEYFKDLNAEKSTLEDLKAAADAYNSSIRQQAIAKAFGEKLVDVEARRLEVVEELRKEQQKLAAAEARVATDGRFHTNIKTGSQTLTSAGRAAADATAAINRLKFEQESLTLASKDLASAMGRAEDSMAGEKTRMAADAFAGQFDSVNGLLGGLNALSEEQQAAEAAALAAADAAADAAEGQGDEAEAVMATVESLRAKARATAAVITEMKELAGQGVAVDLTELDKMQGQLGTILGQLEDLGTGMADVPETITPVDVAPIATDAGTPQLMGASAEDMQARADAAQQLSDTVTSLGPVATEVMAALDSSVATVTANMQGYFDTAFQSVIDGTKTMKQAMGEAAKSIIAALLAETVATAIANAFKTAKNAGPAAAFLGPTLAAAGAAGVKALFNSIPAFADGGIVSGPTLAQVGEYRNASSNPEVIAPLSKLQNMMGGGQRVEVVGVISGQDILISSERAAIDRGRLRGF